MILTIHRKKLALIPLLFMGVLLASAQQPTPLCHDFQFEPTETVNLMISGDDVGSPSSAILNINDAAADYRNFAPICVGSGFAADLYPSNITVEGGPTIIGDLRVTLFDLSYRTPDDLKVLLVGPEGQKFILMADAGGLNRIDPWAPVTLTFQDFAGGVLPDSDRLTTGAYEPTSWESPVPNFPAPAPPGPYNESGSEIGGTGAQTLLGNFGLTNANGVWSLYVLDDTGAGSGRPNGCISGGWGLEFSWNTMIPFDVRGDFDGDRFTDYGVFRESDSTWYYYRSRSQQPAPPVVFGTSGFIPVPGLYDSDFKTDIAIADLDSGDISILSSRFGTVTHRFVPSAPGDIPVVGRFRDPFYDDIAVWRPSTGDWYFNEEFREPIHFGRVGDMPFAMENGGDLLARLAVFRPSEGRWYIAPCGIACPGQNPDYIALDFGLPGDIPVPADYDGDLYDDIAVFRPSTGMWYIRYQNGSVDAFQWGQEGDIPVPGAYDNSAPAYSAAVYRDGTWWVKDGTHQAFQWGLPTDIPIPNTYIRSR